MTTSLFGLVPGHLTGELHRQQTAQHVLDTQAVAGTTANAETVAAFRRYVQGEDSLSNAVAQARAQLAQEHAGFWQELQRRNLL